MNAVMTDQEIRLFWGRLTEEQQEEFVTASVAYHKAKRLVSDQIRDALDDLAEIS